MRQMFRDIKNIFFYRKTIKKHLKDNEWSQFNLRLDWLQRLYTVVTLRKEDMGEQDVTVRNVRFMERFEPIADYLRSLDLGEFLIPHVEPIPESYSFLVRFRMNLIEFTTGYIITRLLIALPLSVIFYFIYRIF